jgi:hypothetical protein
VLIGGRSAPASAIAHDDEVPSWNVKRLVGREPVLVMSFVGSSVPAFSIDPQPTRKATARTQAAVAAAFI